MAESGEICAMRYAAEKAKVETVIDAGANIGQFAREAATVFKDATIYSFEPSRRTFERLEKAAASFPNIRPVNLGVGASPAQMTLHSTGTSSVTGTLYDFTDPYRPYDPQFDEQVEITTIDKFCAERGIDQIDYLKLDIEGHEIEALKGARRMLEAGKIRFIHFEFSRIYIPARVYFRDFNDLLGDRYRFYRIVSDGVYPLDGYTSEREVFLTVNYLAELKAG